MFIVRFSREEPFSAKDREVTAAKGAKKDNPNRGKCNLYGAP
jgi:hypothetical protein